MVEESAAPLALSILLVDDHPVVRRGVADILTGAFPQANVQEAGCGDGALALVRQQPWNIVILDLTLGEVSGLDVLKRIRAVQPGLPVLILSMHGPEQYARRAIAAGASGYLTKETADAELVAAVTQLIDGGKYFGPRVLEQVVIGMYPDGGDRPHERLSDREYEVLRKIGSGETVSKIAADLKLSVKTVSTYRARVLKKMGMRTNADLTHYVVRQGLSDRR
jgi:DNA-binding NarL/FixJ family response regulator